MNILNITLSGNLVRDAVFKTFDSGKSVFNFTVAHNLSSEKVFYADCSFWVSDSSSADKLKSYLQEQLKKGKKVLIQSDWMEIKQSIDKEANMTYRSPVISVSRIDF